MTPKREALELLALDTMTGQNAIRLNILTVKQAGYQVTEFADGTFGLATADGDDLPSWDSHYSGEEAWEDTPDYVTSVDACLTLPVPNGGFWKIRTPVLIRVEVYGADGLALAKEFGRTVPLAMLKAWWTIQPDEDEEVKS